MFSERRLITCYKQQNLALLWTKKVCEFLRVSVTFSDSGNELKKAFLAAAIKVRGACWSGKKIAKAYVIDTLCLLAAR
jgi:hypothetical protein